MIAEIIFSFTCLGIILYIGTRKLNPENTKDYMTKKSLK